MQEEYFKQFSIEYHSCCCSRVYTAPSVTVNHYKPFKSINQTSFSVVSFKFTKDEVS